MYQNPVYRGSCPDPFVLKFCGEYWCYSTGFAPDGRVFEVLHSKDLIHWQSFGGAMEAIAGNQPEYWAPEVTYSNGRFYLYYSVGDGIQMKLRVAIAADPQGPFQDSGRILCDEDFAIDPHVFVDDDGTRYLFYAKDFLSHSHIGTGTVLDKMLDEFTLDGHPRPVTLPRFDWQVFDQNRVDKGGVCWHTIEGPFVMKHKGLYYQMFSGGNWKNISYGVSYAFTDSIHLQQEWTQLVHDRNLPLVLSTIPGEVIGPGHNSVVRGPDNRQLYCVYHRWAVDGSFRLLSLDRLEWIGERLAVLGPSTTLQENPNASISPVFHEKSGNWENFETDTPLIRSSFLVEANFAASNSESENRPDSEYGFCLYSAETLLLTFALVPGQDAAIARMVGGKISSKPLPPSFAFDSVHLAHIEVDGRQAELRLDGGSALWRGLLLKCPDRLSFFSTRMSAALVSCNITYGYQDSFIGSDCAFNKSGWMSLPEKSGKWRIEGGALRQMDSMALNCVLVKEHSFLEYELVINACLINGDAWDSYYGFYPALAENSEGPLFRIEKRDLGPTLAWYSQQANGVRPLPNGFDSYRTQQFRFRKHKGTLQVYLGSWLLGTLEVRNGVSRAALYANKACVAFDLVRLTSLESGQI
jgi:GH43 family beta-xylosidase